MTGADFRQMFQTMTDDDMDDIQFYIFLNAVKDAIESSRDWNFNRAFDGSNTIGASDNYLTTHTLPAQFLSPRKLYLQNDLTPCILISFEERERYKDIYKRYYIDWLNNTFALCGAVGAGGRTLNLYYARSTPAITVSTSPVWPSQFHPILGFLVAEMWGSGSDSDDLNLRMSRENARIGNNVLLKPMIAWDSRIKTMEYNDKNARNTDLSSYPNIVGGDFIY